jgi:hypothetical protein
MNDEDPIIPKEILDQNFNALIQLIIKEDFGENGYNILSGKLFF